MDYYDPTNEKECQKAKSHLEADGFKVSYNTGHVTIIRETSKYNKYMKWHVVYNRDDETQLASQWFKTRKAAVESVTQKRSPLPVGNGFTMTFYNFN